MTLSSPRGIHELGPVTNLESSLTVYSIAMTGERKFYNTMEIHESLYLEARINLNLNNTYP
jgi:hypothetical protein